MPQQNYRQQVPEDQADLNMSSKYIFFSLTLGIATAITIIIGTSAIAVQKDDVRLKAILTQDNHQQPLSYPTALFYDAEADEVYVVDASNNQLVIFGNDGYPTDTVGQGRGLYNIIGGLRHQKKLYVCCGSSNEFLSGSINVLDNAFFPEQQLVLATENSDKVPFIAKRVMASNDKQFYVLKSNNSTINIFNDKWGYSHQITPFYEHLGVKEPATIVDMAHDQQGTMYFLSEKWGHIFVYDQNEKFLFGFGEKGGDKGKLARARGIAVDSKNNRTYISDYLRHAVLVYDMKGRWLYEIGGKGARPGRFFYPSSVCVDNNGNLYVADTFNHRVQIFSINQHKNTEK